MMEHHRVDIFRQENQVCTGFFDVNQLAKVSDDFFGVIHPKNEHFSLRIVPPPLPPPFWPVPPLIFTSCVCFYRKVYLFSRKFDHLYVDLTIFFRKCRPFGSAAWGDSPPAPSVRHWSRSEFHGK